MLIEAVPSIIESYRRLRLYIVFDTVRYLLFVVFLSSV